jgi:hypothetical protein
MLVFMFVVISLMSLGIAGMQYLILCEQRRMQSQWRRIAAATEAFEYRQFMASPMVMRPNPPEWVEIIDRAWRGYEMGLAA